MLQLRQANAPVFLQRYFEATHLRGSTGQTGFDITTCCEPAMPAAIQQKYIARPSRAASRLRGLRALSIEGYPRTR